MLPERTRKKLISIELSNRIRRCTEHSLFYLFLLEVKPQSRKSISLSNTFPEGKLPSSDSRLKLRVKHRESWRLIVL